MCGFFKRNLLGLQKFLGTNSIPTDFCSQKLWGLLFLALEPWAGGLGVGLGFLALYLHPSYQSGLMWLCEEVSHV